MATLVPSSYKKCKSLLAVMVECVKSVCIDNEFDCERSFEFLDQNAHLYKILM